MRKGLIAELGPAAAAINPAACHGGAQREGHLRPRVVGIGGSHVRGVNSRGGISMGSRMREITREEVRAAVDRARSVALPPDREVLHLLPQEFILDDQAGIHDPVGMVGNRLEVNLHLSTCSGGVAQSVVTCANRAGLEVDGHGLRRHRGGRGRALRRRARARRLPGATSARARRSWRSSLKARSRTPRCCPIGGDHFTNDLAVGLHVSVEEAEELKRDYGNCVVTAVPQPNEIEVGGNLAHGRSRRSRCPAAVPGGDSGAARARAVPRCCATICARAACWRRWAPAAF